MSAIPPKADMDGYSPNVCFVPKGDIRVDPEIREVRKLVTSSLFSISPRYLAITFRILVFLTVPMHHTDAGLWGIRGCDLRR
jgi:hypothetical protein